MSEQATLFWERHKGESRQAYHAFSVYRDMGPTRSLSKVAQELNRSKTLLAEWSRKWMWVSRTEAFDAEEDRQRSMELAEHRKQMLETHRKLARNVQAALAARLRRWIEYPDEIPNSQVASLLTASTTLERLTLGESTLNVESRQRTDEPEQEHPDFSMLTDEELEEYVRLSEKLFGPDGG